MRILLWHGWLLSGTGSNVLAGRVAEALRAAGHDVLVVCQERHPDRFAFLDGWGVIDDAGRVGPVTASGAAPAAGRTVLLRPWIGSLLPVFVYDEYEGFEQVVPFVDLSDADLDAYLSRGASALAAAIAWHGSEGVLAAHLVPGGPIAQRAGEATGVPFALMVHGSDIEYAVRPQDRYRRRGGGALAAALAVFGPTEETLRRAVDLAPETTPRRVVVAPGVDVERFRPGPRGESLAAAADLLDADGGLPGGRPAGAEDAVRAAVREGGADTAALDALAASYDQTRPDADAAAKLRGLESESGPIVGYLGKLIPQKGVHLLLAALASLPEARALLIGFGTSRERFEALTVAMDRGDDAAVTALWPDGEAPAPTGLPRDNGLRDRVTFTGRLDHRYASLAVRAMDVLVVPSILEEAFGMVAAEGAAAGALPLVSRHSGLAEVAAAFEGAAASPGLFSFAQDANAVGAIADGVRRLLELAPVRRARIAAAVRARVASDWTWDRAADRYVEVFRS
jgi:glycosyltransferase involved in cell wall biosynthesis